MDGQVNERSAAGAFFIGEPSAEARNAAPIVVGTKLSSTNSAVFVGFTNTRRMIS
jgi:hypothetical protein